MKKIFAVILLAMLVFTGCGQKNDTQDSTDTDNSGNTQTEQTGETTKYSVPTEDDVTAIAEITMEDGGVIKVGLCRDYAPETVDNFIKLAKEGFYDGLTFHRVINGFMIQGGDPQGNGTGGSDQNIKGEFVSNGFKKNTITHARGVISMARANDPNSASSQFFIMHQDNDYLDGQYAAFGFVMSGIEEVDKIADVETDSNDKPVTPVVIKSIKIIQE